MKTSSEKVIPTAKLLADAGMLRAVSLSVQSLSQKTLDAIKRKNLKFDNFEDLIKKFSDQGIQSYTEMIMGLPEETVDSFKENWGTLARINPQPTIMVWNCSVFVNAPMNNPEYIKKYGIEVFSSPIFMSHTSREKSEIKEYEKMVRGTNSLPNGEIHEMYLFNWTMMVFHVFGILEFLSRYYNKQHEIAYVKFYESIMEFCKQTNGIFSKEYLKAVKKAEEGYSGQGWDYYDTELGDISWPVEEAGFLKLVRYEKGNLKLEIENFITFLNKSLDLRVDHDLINDLIEFQLFILNFPEERFFQNINQQFNNNWIDFFNGSDKLIAQKSFLSKPVKNNESDIVKWGYESVWFGRRSHKYKIKLNEIRPIP